MCKRLPLLCLYSLVFVVSSTKAQNPFFISLTENSGLPSNAVYHTFQDSKKYIWLATEKGLSRYDGVSFTSFDMEGESSLAGSNISEDRYGRIWYQSFDGFCYYVENDSLHKLNHEQIFSFQPFAILGNHLFLITTNNIEIYDLSNLRIKKRVKITAHQRIQHCIGYNSNFFLIDGQAIYKIDSTLKSIAFPKQLTSSKNDYRLFVSNNRVYLVEKYNKTRKLYVLDTDNYYEAADIPEPEFIQGVSNINNQYWIHSNYGTYVFNQKGLVKHIFKEYNVSNALVDASGNIWISSINKGIVIVPNANIEASPFENTAKHLQVTKNGYLISFDNNTLVAYNSDFSSSSFLFKHQAKETMRKFLFDEEQNRLFVLAERLTIYDKNFRLTESSVLSVKDLIKLDAQYYAFAATSVIGIIKLNDNSIKTSSFDKLYNTLPEQAPNFKNIQTDFRGKVISYNRANQTFIYSNNKGTFAYNAAGQKEILTPDGKTIYAKKLCNSGTQFFALTNDYKLYKIAVDLKTELLNGKPSVGLKKIEAFEISENKLIIAGGNRVILLNPNNLTETYFNNTLPINIIDVLCFGVHNNTLILLKPETLLKIEIDNKLRNDKTADLFINSIFVNNKKAELTDNLILGYNENNVQVFFTYLDYLKLADNELYYSIDNKNWTQIEPGQRSIKFLSLASGTYQLRFKENDLIIKDGIQIVIKLPFWKKPVFIFASLMAISKNLEHVEMCIRVA